MLGSFAGLIVELVDQSGAERKKTWEGESIEQQSSRIGFLLDKYRIEQTSRSIQFDRWMESETFGGFVTRDHDVTQ